MVGITGVNAWTPPEILAAAQAAQQRYAAEQVNPAMAGVKSAQDQAGMTGSSFANSQLQELAKAGKLSEAELQQAAKYGYSSALASALGKSTGFGAAMARYAVMGGRNAPTQAKLGSRLGLSPAHAPGGSFGGISPSFVDDTPLDSYGY